MGTNILTTQASDDDTLATEAGNPYPVHLIPLASLIGLLQNFAYNFNAAPIAAAAPAQYIAPAFTTLTGKVLVIVVLTAQGGGGTTSPAGEAVQFSVLQDGALVGPTSNGEVGATANFCGSTLVYQSNLVPGSTHTFGVRATNATNAAHTLAILQANAIVFTLDI